MQVRVKAAAACAAVALVAAFGWFLFRDGAQPVATNAPERQAGALPHPATPAPIAAALPGPPAADSAAIPVPAVACAGDPWEAQPGDPCALAMDHRFSGERVPPVRLFSGHAGWHLEEEEEALAVARERGDPPMPTWQDVFDDAEADRARAEAALADAVCSEGGDGVRRAACAADAVAAAGLLQEACITPLAADGLRNPWSPPGDVPYGFFEPAEKTEIWRRRVDWLDADPDLTPDQYWKLRQRAEDAMYRYAWRVMRCAALPESVLTWFEKLLTPSGEAFDGNQSKALYAFAARHGVEWAQARLRLLPTHRSAPPQVLEE